MVDYKTSPVNDAAEAQRLAQHFREQSERYVHAMQSALGREVRFEIWFVRPAISVEVLT